jgi:isoquinoline 1-oxidoreductase beta subunit
METKMTRRKFIKTSVAGFTGLTLGVIYSGDRHGMARDDRIHTGDQGSYYVSPWLNISENNQITIIVVKNEMGQAVSTALAMIVAEELEADWNLIQVEFRTDLEPLVLPGLLATGGSLSIMLGYQPMRNVGAAAKEMLITACARKWSVPRITLHAENSTITHPRIGTITYGELAKDASTLRVPIRPKLKSPDDFKIIGQSLPRLDARAHLEGLPIFGTDVNVPNMMYAAVRQSPVFGGEVLNFDSLDIKGTGAEAIVPIPNGVAVVAKSWWEAEKIIDSLDVEFSHPPDMLNFFTEDIFEQLAEDIKEPGQSAKHIGKPHMAYMQAPIKTSATYEVPLLAHATLEPMTCTAHVTPESCQVWAPTQWARGILLQAQKITNLNPSDIKIYPTSIGGGFGRKAEYDFAVQAILISQAVGKPVKVIWSRSEDIQHDFYRPACRAELSGGIDENGRIVSWVAKCAGPTLFLPYGAEKIYDSMIVTLFGFTNPPYAFPNMSVRFVHSDYEIPGGWLRSISYAQNIFFVESFADELAEAANTDPLEFRMKHLQDNPRSLAVLKRVAEMADWGNPSIPSAAQGVAIMDHWGLTHVAQIAEVSIDNNNKLVIHKVYCAIDCGRAINPDNVKAQMEGGIIFGLSTGLYGEITIENGSVVQSNLHDYRLLKLKDVPDVETSLIESSERPSGVGEYGVPPIVPAVTNAIFSSTGQRIRTLPINKHGFNS